MRLHCAVNGRLLDDGVFADRDHIDDTGGIVSGIWGSKQPGDMRLLHERHDNGVYQRSDPGHRH